MQDIKSGKYLHYKGKQYEVIGTARHSETLEPLVVYRALYDSAEFGDGAIWTRPLKMFLETISVDGKDTPRFRLIEEDVSSSVVTTMRDAQKLVKSFAEGNGWKDHPCVDKFDHLHEELIEMSRHLRYKSKEERIDYIKNNKDIFMDGIGDLFFALCRLSNQLDIDIESAFNMVKVSILERYGNKGSEDKDKP